MSSTCGPPTPHSNDLSRHPSRQLNQVSNSDCYVPDSDSIHPKKKNMSWANQLSFWEPIHADSSQSSAGSSSQPDFQPNRLASIYDLQPEGNGLTQIIDETNAHYTLIHTKMTKNTLTWGSLLCLNSNVSLQKVLEDLNIVKHVKARETTWHKITAACAHSFLAHVARARIRSPQRAVLIDSQEGQDFIASIFGHRLVQDLTQLTASRVCSASDKAVKFGAVNEADFTNAPCIAVTIDGKSLSRTIDQDCVVDLAIDKQWKIVHGPDFESEPAMRVIRKLGQHITRTKLPASAGQVTVKDFSGSPSLLVRAKYRRNRVDDPSNEDETDIVLGLSFLRNEMSNAPPIPKSQELFMTDRTANCAVMLGILTREIVTAYRSECKTGLRKSNTPRSLASIDFRKAAANRLGTQIVNALGRSSTRR